MQRQYIPMKHLLLSISVIFLVLALTSLHAQETARWKTLSNEARTAVQCKAVLRRLLENHGTRAISVAVIQDSRVVYREVIGMVDPKLKQAVNERTVFRGASLGKPVVAYLVMKLVGEGILDLDRPLVQYLDRPLPEFADYKDLKADDRYRLLTARIILSHRSGFPNWRIMNPGGRLDFKFTPGEQFKYSGELTSPGGRFGAAHRDLTAMRVKLAKQS